MTTRDFEESIKEFLALGRELRKATPLTAENALNELIEWYKTRRIHGASLERDDDMLLLQWGAQQPLTVSEPTDLRRLSDSDITFAETSYRYVDVTRQVFPSNGDDTVEFDDVAVQMSITLFYEPSQGNEPSDNMWITTPNSIETNLEEFRAVPFIKELLNASVHRSVITVGHCG